MAATAKITIGPANPDVTLRHYEYKIQIVLTGTYSAASTHGDVLNLASIATYGGAIASTRPPELVYIVEEPAPGTLATGATLIYAKGTTLANGSLQVLTAYNTEYTQNTAYSAGLLAAIFYAIVRVPKI